MKKYTLLLGVVFCAVLSVNASAAEILFQDDFESGVLNWELFSQNTEIISGGFSTMTPFGQNMALMAQQGISDAVLGTTIDITGRSEVDISFDWALESFGLYGNEDEEIDLFNTDAFTFIARADGLADDTFAALSLKPNLDEFLTVGWDSFSTTLSGLVGDTLFIGFQLYNGGILDFLNRGQYEGDYRTLSTGFLDNVLVTAPSASPAPVPEPTTLLLMGSGLLGIALMARSSRMKRAKVNAE